MLIMIRYILVAYDIYDDTKIIIIVIIYIGMIQDILVPDKS